MDPSFKPYRTGMMTVLERYPCGKENGKTKGRCFVYYLCKCDCGKEFIVGGDELSKHPYSCGCIPKPKKGEAGRTNDWALGYDKEKHTMDLHAKTYKSRLFHLQIRCIRSCLEQEKKALGSPYHFPADQTLSRLVQNKKRSPRSPYRR